MSSTYPSTDGIPIQRCQRCRTILPLDQVYCMACGYYNSPVQKTHSTHSFSPRMTTNPLTPPPMVNNTTFPRPGASYNPLTPYPSNIDDIITQPTHPQASISGMKPSFAPPPPPIQPGSNQRAGQYIHTGNNAGAPFPQQPFNPSQNLRPSFPPASFGPGIPLNIQMQSGQRPPFFQPEPPVPPPHRKSRWKVVIGIMVLLIVLIGGGLAGYLFLLQPSSLPNVQPTASVSIPTPTQPPVFADSFQNNAKGWDLQSQNGLFSMTIGQGALTLEDDHNKFLPVAVPGTTTTPLSNFLLTFDAQLASGDPANGYGLNIRGTTDQNGVLSACYRIEFYGDGTYAVFKLATNTSGTITITRLVNYTSTPAIHKRGSVNHLSIVAKGSSFTLIANGQILKNISDRSYSSGSIEFFVSNLTDVAPDAQAKFSQVAIYNN